MKPGRYPMMLEEGVGWSRSMTWRSGAGIVPLSAYTAKLTIRHPITPGVYLLTLTEGDGIELSDVAPNIVISITKEQVGALGITESTYRLDLTPPSGQSFPLLKDQAHVEKW